MREQYSLAKILGIWALAAAPMGILGWIAFPLLAPDFESDPFGSGVTRVVLLTLGLIWLFVLSNTSRPPTSKRQSTSEAINILYATRYIIPLFTNVVE